MRRLNVWWDDRLVGELRQTNGGALEFRYSDGWLTDHLTPPLSLSLRKRESAFKEKECRPFFAGLLPEEAQRTRAAAALGVSAANDFALLELMGADVAGAIEILVPGMSPRGGTYETQSEPLSDRHLIGILERLPMRPFLVGEGGNRLSLAGAQSKLPVVLVDNEVALPKPGQPTTHILKPAIADFVGTTENEALVMRLAEAVGLHAADVEPRTVAGKSFLLVKRYDRAIAANGRVRRIHQEDFCQALGVLPHRKYAKEGGPNFRQSFELVRSSSAQPARDILGLMDAALFNLIVGNADAHGKNFSLVHEAEQTRLAPLYDLLSTVHYPSLSPDMAMKIGQAGRLTEANEANWRRFSEDSAIPLKHVARRLQDLCIRVEQQLASVHQRLSSTRLSERHLDSVLQTISSRLALAKGLPPLPFRS